ncbi:MAG: NAD-dependent epimerase/dehydratase family protein [Leptospirillia bacterium]
MPDGPVLIVGCGYAGKAVARRLSACGVPVTGTVTGSEGADAVIACGATPEVLDLRHALEGSGHRLAALIEKHPYIVYAAGPNRVGDSERFVDFSGVFAERVRRAGNPSAFVYLSSTGVYGYRGGDWVDEDTPPGDDLGPRGMVRVAAEAALLAACKEWGLPLRILRPAGIYGPGRHVGARIAGGHYRVIEADPPIVVNRIHVDDLARAVTAALVRGTDGGIYLVADGHPTTLREVADYAAALMGLDPPPGEPAEAARARMGEANFHLVSDSKRCRNRRLLDELRVKLAYPDYKNGLKQAMQVDGLIRKT